MNFVNKNQIKQASIMKPYKNSGESFDMSPSHGWQLVLVMEYCSDGYHHRIVIDKNSEDECHAMAQILGLINYTL